MKTGVSINDRVFSGKFEFICKDFNIQPDRF